MYDYPTGLTPPPEQNRKWGEPIAMSEAVRQRVDAIWKDLGL